LKLLSRPPDSYHCMRSPGGGPRTTGRGRVARSLARLARSPSCLKLLSRPAKQQHTSACALRPGRGRRAGGQAAREDEHRTVHLREGKQLVVRRLARCRQPPPAMMLLVGGYARAHAGSGGSGRPWHHCGPQLVGRSFCCRTWVPCSSIYIYVAPCVTAVRDQEAVPSTSAPWR